MLRACPVCHSPRLHYAFSIAQYRLMRCSECAFLLLNPQPSDDELRSVYAREAEHPAPEQAAESVALQTAVAEYYLGQCADGSPARGKKLLHLWVRPDRLSEIARARGYDVTSICLSNDVADSSTVCDASALLTSEELAQRLSESGISYDACLVTDALEHVRQPIELLQVVRKALHADGCLMLAIPSLDSWSGRWLKQRWMEFKPEHLTYFKSATLQSALFAAGYQVLRVTEDRRPVTLNHLRRHFDRFEVPLYSTVVRILARLAPARLRRAPRSILTSGLIAIAQPRAHPERRMLSIIVPAYNEAATFRELMDALLLKRVPGLEIEIIIVESASTDGTREIVQSYAHHAGVRLILQDRARGKGNAVRAGLEAATGDFILIQDSDLEYDLDDYDALLEPLMRGTEAFVLGSRHGGSAWKMRKFERQRLLSGWLNFGHWFFTTLINVLFRQKLRDPFTMFKVFRRDCLHGVTFECNRFDFDIELLVKLVRKGYTPLEIPVNYRSRSFKEGKKVSMLRDPFTWIRVLLRLRFTRAGRSRGALRLT